MNDLSARLRDRRLTSSTAAKVRLVFALTWPSVMAQLSTIVMEYIDASMVGSLGAAPAASIGLVATTTWLFWGLGVAAVSGYSVLLAHRVGAGDNEGARHVLRRSLPVIIGLGILLATIGCALAPWLPGWLGGSPEVNAGATAYFGIFAAALPLVYLTYLSSSMIRSSGNMMVPGVVNVIMCLLDVIFNFMLIFETRQVDILGVELTVPGAGMGVAGAALGTAMAYTSGGLYMFAYMLRRSPVLRGALRRISLSEYLHPYCSTVRRATVISWPIALERIVMCSAQIFITAIVAPLGAAAIAANAFAVTAESLCYTPGYGVGDAATTLVGQSLGAGRPRLAVSFGRISIACGMAVMGILGAAMWLLAPEMIALFTPDATVRALGADALRTEAWAEPLFGASIVTYCVFIGAGYTKVPAAINFTSIWAVRITLSALLVGTYGLHGVWLAMCIELCVRGTVFLWCFMRGRWLRPGAATVVTGIEDNPPGPPEQTFEL